MKNSTISRLFNRLSLLLIGTTLTLFTIISFSWQFISYSIDSKKIETRLIGEYNHLLKSEVSRVVEYIQYSRKLVEDRLKKDIKARVGNAYLICSNIYNHNKGEKNISTIKKEIIETLRPLRFNNGRGYFFITELNGIERLFADHPEMEGKNLIDMQDTDGKYVIREMIEIARSKGEGFIRYTWTKPGVSGNHHIKIASIKYFKPLNWFIGTGEYLSDVEQDIQIEVLNWIETIHFENGGYIFAGTFDGISLSGPSKGKNMLHITDADGVKIVEELIALAKEDGGFIQYIMPSLEEQVSAPKMSYALGIKEWQWYVGSGIYTGEIKNLIRIERNRFFRNIIIYLAILLSISTIVFIINIISMRQITRTIDSQVYVFVNFFKESSRNNQQIDTTSLKIDEFVTLARYANMMSIDRQHLENILRNSEEKLRIIYNQTYQLIGLLNPDGTLIDANQTALDMIGKDLKDIHGKLFWETPWWEHSSELQSQLKQAIVEAAGGMFIRFEAVHIDSNGKPHDIDFSITPVCDKNGTVVSLIPEGRDITHQKEILHNLQKEQHFSEEVLDSLPGIFFMYTKDGKMVRWNRNHELVTGFTPEELYGRSVGSYFGEDDRQKVLDVFQDVFTKGSANIEASLVTKNGTAISYYFSGVCMHDENSNYLIGYGIDISERIAMQKALTESEELYRTMFDTATDGILIMQDDRFIRCNERALEIYGCTMEQIIGTTPVHFSPPFQPDGAKSSEKAAGYINAALNGEPQFFEWFHCRLDGTLFYAEVSLNRLLINGEYFLLVVNRDITNRKKTNDALLESEETLRFVTDHVTDMIWRGELDKLPTFVTPSVKQILGYEVEEMMQMKLRDIVAPESLANYKDYFDLLRKEKPNKTITLELEHICKDGSRKWCEVSLVLLYNRDEKYVDSIGITRDISQRKKAEQELAEMLKRLNRSYKELQEKQDQLIQSGKMAALGTLASGMAHEITQPLTGISMGLEKMVIDSINNKLELGSVKEKSKRMLEYVFRIKKTIEHIRVFSRDHGNEELIPINIDESLNNSLLLVNTQYRNHDIIIEIISDENTPTIMGNVYKVEQIIINLLSNARDALIEKANIARKPFKKKITISTGLLNEEVYIKVHDNGTGISKDIQDHVFEPFYTSKETGKGTGLGLSITFGIVLEMGGTISVTSKKGSWCEFVVLFPAVY